MHHEPRVSGAAGCTGCADLPRALCAAGRGACAGIAGRSRPRRRGRGAHRRPRTRLVEAIRARAGGLGGIEDFLHAYSLSTKEGLALMVLAEALLRVPDAATADRLIEDKLAAGDWSQHEVKSNALPGLGLGLDARHHGAHHPARRDARNPSSTAWSSGSACRRCAPRRGRRCGCSARISCSGRPSRRRCSAPARTANSAIRSTCWARARAPRPTPSATSRPMRAPSTRSAPAPATRALPARPGISVKLSALHPRYEAVSRERVLAELMPRVLELARQARDARSQLHRRCRGGRPARTVARRDRGGAGRSVAAPAGTASGLRCRPIRSARRR